MNIEERAKIYESALIMENSWVKTDPDFMERLLHFTVNEVVNIDDLDDKDRTMAILATLIGCQAVDLYRNVLKASLNKMITPVEVKEIVYQAVDYLGIGRVYSFLTITNEVFKEFGIALPLEHQAKTTLETRLEQGIKAQMDIFGEGMKDFWQSGPEDCKHINKWLAENCFGDYYTRGGLDLRQRELITFCFIAAQGGCENQLIAHAKGNMNVGNDKDFLLKIVSQCLPYIGYPRSLNAITCIRKACEN